MIQIMLPEMSISDGRYPGAGHMDKKSQPI